MTSKNPRARHRRFLSAGFFPPEAPPCFYSELFAKSRNSISADMNKIPKRKNGDPDFFSYKSNKTTFNFPRFRSMDRQHAFINPISYFFISKTLSENYIDLRRIEKKSRITSTPSIFDWSGERALRRPNFDARDAFMVQIKARFENGGVSDVRSFFHSIYTHAIAWAIHGKAFCKQNRSFGHYGNLLDLLCRNSQDGQTIGLPVGPDTSRMIAEVVGCAIDAEIQRRLKLKAGDASRFVDDYAFGQNSRIQAEHVISVIRRACNSFELDINNEKTFIFSSSEEADHANGWKNYIRNIIPDSTAKKEDIELFFFQVDRMAAEQRYANVQKFSIQSIRKLCINTEHWKTVENYLISSYRKNPTIVNNLVELVILRFKRNQSDISLPLMSDFVNSRIEGLTRQNKLGEAAWLLFLANSLSIPLRAKSLQGIESEADPMCALLIADAAAVGRVTGKIDMGSWNKNLSRDGLDGPMWLYVYETTMRNINGVSSDAHLVSHPYFNILKSRKVSFYRNDLGIYNLNSVLRMRRKENKANLAFFSDFDDDFSVDIEEVDEDTEYDEDEDNSIY